MIVNRECSLSISRLVSAPHPLNNLHQAQDGLVQPPPRSAQNEMFLFPLRLQPGLRARPVRQSVPLFQLHGVDRSRRLVGQAGKDKSRRWSILAMKPGDSETRESATSTTSPTVCRHLRKYLRKAPAVLTLNMSSSLWAAVWLMVGPAVGPTTGPSSPQPEPWLYGEEGRVDGRTSWSTASSSHLDRLGQNSPSHGVLGRSSIP